MIEDQYWELGILACQGSLFVTVRSDIANAAGDDLKKEIPFQAQEILGFQQCCGMPSIPIIGRIPHDHGDIPVSVPRLRKGIGTIFIHEIEMGNPNLIRTRWLW
jgi:hypothetical protein